VALFWKEWRESVVALLSTVVITAGLAVLVGQNDTMADDARNALVCLPLLWPLLALIAAAPAFAGEMRDGTLPFLAQLPVSRRGIWAVKAAAAIARWALCATLSILLWLVLCVLYLRVSPTVSPFDSSGQWLPPFIFGLCLSAAVLGAALLLSPLINSSAITGVAAIAFVVTVLALYDRRPAGVEIPFEPLPLALAFLVAALRGSRAAFLAGELRPGPRKVAAAMRAIGGFIVLAATVWLVIVIARHA
jgi:hypothetical protein